MIPALITFAGAVAYLIFTIVVHVRARRAGVPVAPRTWAIAAGIAGALTIYAIFAASWISAGIWGVNLVLDLLYLRRARRAARWIELDRQWKQFLHRSTDR